MNINLNQGFTLRTMLFPLLLICIAYACSSGGRDQSVIYEPTEADMELIALANRYFTMLPEPRDHNTPIALLGKKLYYEEAVSASGEMSCNTCHPVSTFGVDNKRVSPGHDGTLGTRNSPTTFNAFVHTMQFWDGRSPDLEEQAKEPVLNPVEMGLATPEQVEVILASIPGYQDLFAAAFPDERNPLTFDNFARAVAAFQETLATPSPFDDFLSGKADALTEIQKEGLQLFIHSGCVACHSGAGLGGTMMQRFGLIHSPYYEFTKSDAVDLGLAEVTGQDRDMYLFKTSGLRNIEKTAPYFHDGSVDSLEEAIQIMAYTQYGRRFKEKEVASIIDFFRSLTGEIPQHAL